MPQKCCVPSCKGNYTSGPKVSVFSFPKDENLLAAWKQAICRDNFTPTKNSKVCELHFHKHQIEWTVSMYDEKAGKKITAPLSHPRLAAGAIPSLLPGFPKRFSKQRASRKSSASKRCQLENKMLEVTVEKSAESSQVYVEKMAFNDMCELKTKLPLIMLAKEWVIKQEENAVIFLLIVNSPHPFIKCHIQICENLEVKLFCREIEVKSLPSFKFPVIVSSINQIEIILSQAYSKFVNYTCSHDSDSILLIADILQHLSNKIPDKKEMITSLKEQVLRLRT